MALNLAEVGRALGQAARQSTPFFQEQIHSKKQAKHAAGHMQTGKAVPSMSKVKSVLNYIGNSRLSF